VPLDELHGQEGAAIGQGAEIVHWRDAGVLELPGDAGLVGEAAGGAGVGGVLLLQYLNGYLAVQGGVGGAVNDPHAAAGDLGQQLVALPRRIPGQSGTGARCVRGQVGFRGIGRGVGTRSAWLGHRALPGNRPVRRPPEDQRNGPGQLLGRVPEFALSGVIQLIEVPSAVPK
jgi:hypothetical protein